MYELIYLIGKEEVILGVHLYSFLVVYINIVMEQISMNWQQEL